LTNFAWYGQDVSKIGLQMINNLVSGAKLAHAAVRGGDYRVTPAPGTAQGALLHHELT